MQSVRIHIRQKKWLEEAHDDPQKRKFTRRPQKEFTAKYHQKLSKIHRAPGHSMTDNVTNCKLQENWPKNNNIKRIHFQNKATSQYL